MYTRTYAIMAAHNAIMEIVNPSLAPVRNGVHPSEFVFQKSLAMVSDFRGIQTHEGELRCAQAPMMDSLSSTMFFL